MAIYLDPVSGNDSTGDGSLGNPYKTITAGATAARIAPGDEVRIKKSLDPASLGVNVTFTDASTAATLASALTANISRCEDAWTQSANVTQSNSTSRKEGSYSQQFVIATAFTTGKVAYFDFGAGTELNLSAYQKIALWFYTSIDLAANIFRIDLCSDATGDTPIDAGHQFTIAQATGYDSSGSAWHRIVLNKGSALSGSVRSISIHALSDPGSVTIRLDNIVACNTFHQHCLIGDGTNDWYPITCINGTDITLATEFRDYTGSLAGAKAAYAVYDFYSVDTLPTGYSTVGMTIQDSGTSGSPILFRGGWNFSTDSQDGYTNWTTHCGLGYHLSLSAKDYLSLENMRFIGGFRGITDGGSSSEGIGLKNIEVYETTGQALYLNTAGTYISSLEGTIRIVASVNDALFGISEELTWTGDIIWVSTGTGKVHINDLLQTGQRPLLIWTGNFYGGCGGSASCLRIATTAHVRNIVLSSGFIEVSSGCTVIIERLETLMDSPYYYSSTLWESSTAGQIQRLDILNFVCPDDTPGGIYLTYVSKLGGIYVHAINGDASKYWANTGYLDFGDHVTMGQAADWGYGGTGKAVLFSPTSTTIPAYHRFMAPVVSGETYKLTFQVRGTTVGGNSSLKVNIFGAGITAVRNETVTVTTSWAKYESTAFTPDTSGYVVILLKFLDGSTSTDIGLDDIAVEKQ